MADSLDKLTIRGFKSIRQLEGFELKNLNVLIGGNGAGKSNFVGFFQMLRAMINGGLDDHIRNGGGAGDFLFNGPKVTPEMEFETSFHRRGYRFKLKPTRSNQCVIADEARYYKGGTSGWWEFPNKNSLTSALVEEAKGDDSDSRNSKTVYDSIASWQIYHFHDTGPKAPMRDYEIIQDNKNLRFDATNIAPYLLKLKNQHKDSYREIVDTVRLVIPFFNDFILEATEFGELQKVNLSWQQKGSDYPMQPYHLSDGSIRFICLATALLQPSPPATIIIDEPELGLHPYAIDILAELITNASENTQVIISTQSPALVNNFAPEDVVVVNRKDGASTFERLDSKDLESWLESYSLGELWSKNVLTGGPTHE